MVIDIATRWFLLGRPYGLHAFSSQFAERDGFVGRNFFREYAKRKNIELAHPTGDDGVLPGLMELGCESFDPLSIDPTIRSFLMHSARYEMDFHTEWHGAGWRIANKGYRVLAKHVIGNLNLPPDDARAATLSSISGLDVDRDRKPDYSVWVRTIEGTDELFYIGAFKTYVAKVRREVGAYLAGAFPLPFGAQLTAVFRLRNQGAGLLYESCNESEVPDRVLAESEAGIYLLFPHTRTFSAFPGLGLGERFEFSEPLRGGDLHCTHTSTFLGVPMFSLHYTIRPSPSAGL